MRAHVRLEIGPAVALGHAQAKIHADRLEQTDRRGFMHLRTKYWRDGRFRLSEAGIQSIVAAIEATVQLAKAAEAEAADTSFHKKEFPS